MIALRRGKAARVHVLDPGAAAGSRTALCGEAGLPVAQLRLVEAHLVTCRDCASQAEALVALAIELAAPAPREARQKNDEGRVPQLARAERLRIARRFAFASGRDELVDVEVWPAGASDPAGGGWRAARRSAS